MRLKIVLLGMICMGTFFISVADELLTNELPRGHEERLQEIEKETYNLIDEIFAHARNGAINKEDMVTLEWFMHSPVDTIQHILSDMRIESSFDSEVWKTFSQRKDAYLQKKIVHEFDNAVDGGAGRAQMRQFLVMSKVFCDLSEGSHCKRLMRTIKVEKKEVLSLLKREERACCAEQRLMLERFVLGIRPMH